MATVSWTLGRKLSCLLYTIFYGLACVSKHFNSFYILFFGRVMSGIATSLLHSSFESWMIHEHRKEGYPEHWMDKTFQVSLFCHFLNCFFLILHACCSQARSLTPGINDFPSTFISSWLLAKVWLLFLLASVLRSLLSTLVS
jgi:hypothetical protein